MPPEEGKHLARHLLSPKYESVLRPDHLLIADDNAVKQARIKTRKEAIISLSKGGKGKLLSNNHPQRLNQRNGNISLLEKKLGEGQFIFLHLVVMPDKPLPKTRHVHTVGPLPEEPNNDDHYGFAFEIETLASLQSYYRDKDYLPKYLDLWDEVKKDEREMPRTDSAFESLEEDVKRKLWEGAKEIQADPVSLADKLLECGELDYQKNLPDLEIPEILVQDELDIGLASWFIVGGEYLNKEEFKSWKRKTLKELRTQDVQ